ncbi:MAG: MBL fold metallo-hydrolase [Puia sp.]
MLREHVNKLDAVLFTHPHKDHIAGLDDIRAFNFFSGKPMPVFANEMTQEVIIREFPYAFTDFRYPGVPEIQLNTIATDPFMIGDIQIIPIQVWHLKMPVLGSVLAILLISQMPIVSMNQRNKKFAVPVSSF